MVFMCISLMISWLFCLSFNAVLWCFNEIQFIGFLIVCFLSYLRNLFLSLNQEDTLFFFFFTFISVTHSINYLKLISVWCEIRVKVNFFQDRNLIALESFEEFFFPSIELHGTLVENQMPEYVHLFLNSKVCVLVLFVYLMIEDG